MTHVTLAASASPSARMTEAFRSCSPFECLVQTKQKKLKKKTDGGLPFLLPIQVLSVKTKEVKKVKIKSTWQRLSVPAPQSSASDIKKKGLAFPMCPHANIYLSSYYYICVLSLLVVLILEFVYHHTTLCVLILLYIIPARFWTRQTSVALVD